MKKYILILLLSAISNIGHSQTYFSYTQNMGTIYEGIVYDYSKTTFDYKITIDSLTITVKDLFKSEIIFSATFEKTQSNEFGTYYTLNSKLTPYFFHSIKEKYITIYIPDGLETHYICMEYQ